MSFLDKITKRKIGDELKKIGVEKKPVKSDKKETKPVSAKPTTEKKVVKKTKKDTKPTRGALAHEFGGRSALVLLAPVLTEKASAQEKLGKYSFYVATKATKVEVAEAVRDLYGVKPVSVRISNIKGKEARFGRRTGRKKDRKKAIVTLKSGDAISLYE